MILQYHLVYPLCKLSGIECNISRPDTRIKPFYINWYQDHHTLHLIGFYSKIWVINATFHNISVILWRPVVWVRKIDIPTSLWCVLSYKVKWVHHVAGELWVLSGDLYGGNQIFNQNKSKMTPILSSKFQIRYWNMTLYFSDGYSHPERGTC